MDPKGEVQETAHEWDNEISVEETAAFLLWHGVLSRPVNFRIIVYLHQNKMHHYYLRNRKHVPYFYRFIETRVEV